jgi:hypothetical protein
MSLILPSYNSILSQLDGVVAFRNYTQSPPLLSANGKSWKQGVEGFRISDVDSNAALFKGFYYFANTAGVIYKTKDFKRFVLVRATPVKDGQYNLNLDTKISFFTSASYPNRLFMAAKTSNSSWSNWLWVMYSDDEGGTWTEASSNPSLRQDSFLKGCNGTTYWICGAEVQNNSSVNFYYVNKGSSPYNIQTVSSVVGGAPLEIVEFVGDFWAINYGSIYKQSITNIGTPWQNISLSSIGFQGLSICANKWFSTAGQVTIAVAGRITATNKLGVAYAINGQNTFTLATNIPDLPLSVNSFQPANIRIACLPNNRGFVVAYSDSNENALSGFLFSQNGIDWVHAENSNNYHQYACLFVNEAAF